jgi:predicted alpha/beta hydrolase family esterase
MNRINKQVLFIQGGGSKEDYETDKSLVDSLQQTLGEAYTIYYPRLPNESVPDLGRIKQIGHQISLIEGELIVVGHSLGASMLLKYVSETQVKKKTTALFLIATPFWNGDEDWKEGFKLAENFADKLSKAVPIFLYHSQDDDEVPFAHLALYRQKLPWATFRELPSGGHQLDNDLIIVANDIKSL